jgi:hypothetical protein
MEDEMAQLPPDGEYLIQQIDGMVILFNQYTEEELVKFDPADANATAQAQGHIYGLEQLNPEQKCFAHFWSGYFHAHTSSLSQPISFIPGKRVRSIDG